MGSRRKRRGQRSTAGAAGVSRQARGGGVELPAGTTTGIHAVVAPSGPPPPPSITHTGSQRRVVTREAEDGSFEIVYEHVTEPDDGDDDSLALQSTPLWKNKILLGAALGVAALVLLAGGVVTVITVLGSNGDRASKVTAADKPEEAHKKAYEYVPPSKNEGRIDLAAEPEQDDAPTVPTTAEPSGRRAAPASPGGTNDSPGAPDSLGPSPMPVPRIGDGLRPASLTGAPAMPNLAPRLGDSIRERKDIIKPSRTPADGTTDPSDDGSGPEPEENPSGEEEDDDTAGEQEERSRWWPYDGENQGGEEEEGDEEEKDDDDDGAEEEEEN